MPDRFYLLTDSLSRLTALKASQDSLRLTKQSAISYWLDQVLSPEHKPEFVLSLLLVFGGLLFAFLLSQRRKRLESVDRLQAQALQFASLALLALASKGLFFIIASFALAGILAPGSYGQLYWLGWQISLVWFVYCSFMFALGFTRSRKSYDLFFAVSLALVFLIITGLYNEWFWKWLLYKLGVVDIDPIFIDKPIVSLAPPFPIGTELLMPEISVFARIALLAHFTLALLLFSYAAYLIFRRARLYQDDSAKRATYLLSLAFLLMALFGLYGLLKFRSDLSTLASNSYLAALVLLVIFFFSVRNTYRHGRYKRA